MARVIHGRPGIYNASGITLSDGEGAGLALDSKGRIILGDGAGVLRVTAGYMAAGQSGKYSAGIQSINTGATVPVNTVTAGKTFYITDISLATDSTASVDAKIQSNGVTIFETFLISSAPCNMQSIETPPFATSGSVVTILLPTVVGKNVTYFISGYEQ